VKRKEGTKKEKMPLHIDPSARFFPKLFDHATTFANKATCEGSEAKHA
jgi:hypothetical protein